MKNTIFIILFIVSLLGCQSKKETKVTSKINPFTSVSKLVDQYAENRLKLGHTNSIAVAIYKDGKTYNNYYGQIDKNTNNKPTDSSLYEIASITKIFAGMLAAKAVLDKKITLEDDIRTYLKGNYSNLEFEGNPITIKDLLTHTLGLSEKRPPKFSAIIEKINKGDFENKPIDYNFNDLLEELKIVTLNKKPGTVYNYNSIGPELIAYTLQQVYKKPYKALLQDFLDDLDMKNTFLLDNSKSNIKKLVNGYNEAREIAPKDKNSLIGGAYGLISTLPDLMKLMVFQLESKNPLIKESTRVLFEDNDDNTMGYLWQDLGIGQEEGFYYSKTGTSGGIQSGLLVCPDSNYAQIIIINNTSEASFNDWATLYNKIETDLIKYPKINLVALLKPEFIADFTSAKKQYRNLKKQDSSYFYNASLLNALGYDFLNNLKDEDKAIELFQFAIEEYPDNGNLYDSLSEIYFTTKNYKKALENYKKAYKLNPENNNAKAYILKLEKQLKN